MSENKTKLSRRNFLLAVGASGAAGAARFQGDQAAGLRRHLSGRVESVRGTSGSAAKAQAERLVAALRARGIPGARVRIPVRLSRPAAHGHRPGAARA